MRSDVHPQDNGLIFCDNITTQFLVIAIFQFLVLVFAALFRLQRISMRLRPSCHLLRPVIFLLLPRVLLARRATSFLDPSIRFDALNEFLDWHSLIQICFHRSRIAPHTITLRHVRAADIEDVQHHGTHHDVLVVLLVLPADAPVLVEKLVSNKLPPTIIIGFQLLGDKAPLGHSPSPLLLKALLILFDCFSALTRSDQGVLLDQPLECSVRFPHRHKLHSSAEAKCYVS
ncbi:Hypothetical protein MexAM1_META1p2786 [Methylorubrum extorquens AM1]|uniref:Uncharacterized protein n=1 Tax=Methylorubrum extorquens (strain ATCC 14718 / DSM 1338 / JCM 2805 / NCIMB 9133 / AM1) TaxID=272630 RepID=C5ATL6_METEA|nr:Hypothetical protein MexAM1_META1p2786 [Methylorubrum extorquens AM1]